MNSKGFEFISRNCDVVIEIYKYLNFANQLKLACVNAPLQTIFKQFVWPIDYRELKIYNEMPGRDYVITSAHASVDGSSVRLNIEEYQHFLTLYADSVEKATLKAFHNITSFRNLISLKCCMSNYLMGPLLQMLKENLPFLQSLWLTNCHITSELLEEELLHNVVGIESLRLLSIHFSYSPTITYEHFYHIVSNLKLQTLRLTSVSREVEAQQSALTHGGLLQTLEIDIPFDADCWFNHQAGFLNILENISTLELRISKMEFTNETLQLLAETCKNLQRLTLRRTKFSEIKYFVLSPSVNDLGFHYCSGLTQKNLRQILSEPNRLRTFRSDFTSYTGVYEEFLMPASIQSLFIDTLDVRPIRWTAMSHQFRGCFSPRLPEHIIDLICSIPLASCENLHTLKLHAKCYVGLQVLLSLKKLNTLKMWIPTNEWHLIAALLRLPALRNLHIICHWLKVLKAPFEGFPTAVQTLKIENFFEEGLDFFLDLFARNSQMILTFNTQSYDSIKQLKKLFKHEKFPLNLRTLQCNGFTLDCADLRRDFDAATQHCKDLYEDFGNTSNRIVLRRSK
ncbi:uncharacterized protein LOC106081027 isoform X1 [Stomoxys calcitrans]|uniref:F-box domain-containing protein n=1 Tax=Stomoxys calcitrans TaxID=35570 RepID=A0A1I8PWA6_STOCA|nr:uncharacterized protein LOC106081027 isoform X1 [Stomoxys calcitrans]XP_059225020.1 uncharacterized protein LOC106081027 isoform X1 [Stomoxys calcitrans]